MTVSLPWASKRRHSRLEVLQRYLLANSVCEGLSEAERYKARSALIGEISRTQPPT